MVDFDGRLIRVGTLAPAAAAVTTLIPTGIPSEEAFGTPIVTESVTLIPTGIPSEEAFGTPVLVADGVLLPTGIPSEEVFGTPIVTGALLATGIPSEEAFGTPSITLTTLLLATGIPSEEAFGTPVLTAPILPAGIPSEEVFGRPLVFAPADLAIAPVTGTFRGGEPLRFRGGQLNMTACADTFADGVVGPLWVDISSGGGSVTESAALSALTLDSGLTAGALAGVQTADQMLDFDAEAVFELAAVERPTYPARPYIAELGLKLAASDSSVRIRIRLEQQARLLYLETRVNGELSDFVRTPLATNTATGARNTLRILRAGRQIILFQNGQVIANFKWFEGLAHIELIVRNDAVVSSRTVTRVRTYTRRPVVRLGDEAVRDLRIVGIDRAEGSAPKVECDIDTVDTLVTGCTGSPSVIASGFTYVREADLIQFTNSGAALVVCNDAVLTKG